MQYIKYFIVDKNERAKQKVFDYMYGDAKLYWEEWEFVSLPDKESKYGYGVPLSQINEILKDKKQEYLDRINRLKEKTEEIILKTDDNYDFLDGYTLQVLGQLISKQFSNEICVYNIETLKAYDIPNKNLNNYLVFTVKNSDEGVCSVKNY